MWSIVFSPTAKSSEEEGGIVSSQSTMFRSFHRVQFAFVLKKGGIKKITQKTFTLLYYLYYYIYRLQIRRWTFFLQAPKWQTPAEKTEVMTHLNSLHLFPGGFSQAPVQWEHWYQGTPLARMLGEIEE